jgi:hypothetical protein
VSTASIAISAVEIAVTLSSISPAARPSMPVAALHNRRTSPAPLNCISPYFMTGFNGLCLPPFHFTIKPSDRIAGNVNVSVALTFAVFSRAFLLVVPSRSHIRQTSSRPTSRLRPLKEQAARAA